MAQDEVCADCIVSHVLEVVCPKMGWSGGFGSQRLSDRVYRGV